MWYTAFKYYLYNTVFRHISFFSIITITPYLWLFEIFYTVRLDHSRCLSVGSCNTIVIFNTGITTTIYGCCLILLHTLPKIWANTASSWSTYTHVSALYWYEDHYGLVYCINVIFRTIQGECLLYSYTLLTCLCEIVKFLLVTVITVTTFVWGQPHIFVIAIVTCKCAISILQILRFGVCHRY